MVFQESNQLFPWRTVMDNVAYPLRVIGKSREEAEETAGWYLEMTGAGAGCGSIHIDSRRE